MPRGQKKAAPLVLKTYSSSSGEGDIIKGEISEPSKTVLVPDPKPQGETPTNLFLLLARQKNVPQHDTPSALPTAAGTEAAHTSDAEGATEMDLAMCWFISIIKPEMENASAHPPAEILCFLCRDGDVLVQCD